MSDEFITKMQIFALIDGRESCEFLKNDVLSAVWTVILTAPIHCRRTRDVMLNFSRSVLKKKQSHLHFGWPEVEYIFS